MRTILHADDHPMIRAGIKTILEGHKFHHITVDSACDGDSAFEKVKKNDYDLVILDVSMPGTDCFGLISNILAQKPETKILIFSVHSEDVYAKKFFQMGVMGYLSKDSSVAEIENAATQIIFNNKKYMSANVTQMLTEQALGKKGGNPFDSLSPREFEIVQYLAMGESLASISQILNLHTSTVGTFKARIFEKLNCNNVIALNELAKLNRILPAA
jgi:two-component system, NarL family, invasion response regulator UvrY